MDTATGATTVALLDTVSGSHTERRDDPPAGARPRHTGRLLALAEETLRGAGLGWSDIDLIAVGVGPGTFTGIRIGVASARALAAARRTPIVGVSTLHALAAGAASAAQARGCAPLAVLDARRREVFVAGWSVAGSRDVSAPALLAARAIAPGALAAELAHGGAEGADGDGAGWFAVGDGACEARAALLDAGAVVPEDGSALHRVSATEICRLALGATPGEPGDIRPEYLRVPDAELNRRAIAPEGSR